MKYTKYDKLIDESYPEERQAVYEKLKKELGLPDDTVAPAESRSADTAAEKPASKWRIFLKKPACLAACISAAIAVVCLAIILPFTLNGGGLQTVTPPSTQAPSDRFCKAAACKEIELNYSLKEYSYRNSLSILYVNWYDIAEIKTSLHVDNEDQTDIVYFEEVLIHKGTGSIVELYITDVKTKIDRVEDYRKYCNSIYVIRDPNVAVRWGFDSDEKGEDCTYMAFFTYNKYRYTLVLRYPMDENSIFELVDSMLPKNKK